MITFLFAKLDTGGVPYYLNRHKERTKTGHLVSTVSEFFKEQSSFVNYLIFLFIKQSHICKFVEVNE